MQTNPLIAIVLAAGKGTRMASARPKVLHPLAGRPMLLHLLDTLTGISPAATVVVAGPDMAELTDAVADHPLSPKVAVQQERLGTGDAVKAGLAATEISADDNGTVLILFGDTPLLTEETIRSLMQARAATDAPGVVVLGFRTPAPGAYGRLIVNADGHLQSIVEAKDASPAELALELCNSGLMAVDAGLLPAMLAKLTNDNANGEYYLTDIVALARSQGRTCAFVEGVETELMGINTRVDLAAADAVIQQKLRHDAMAAGTSMHDPASVYLSWDTEIGRDVTLEPNVVFGPGVTIADNVLVRAFSHIEGSSIGEGAIVGPFARLRPGADIGTAACIGNFVEIKNAVISAGAKANHLSYIGDAAVGPSANIGAGTITCNYDGFVKSKTDIGAGAFIGSNTALVAPVKVGEGAITGAGSVITRDVQAGSLAVERTEQRSLLGWATKFRNARRKQNS